MEGHPSMSNQSIYGTYPFLYSGMLCCDGREQHYQLVDEAHRRGVEQALRALTSVQGEIPHKDCG